jgi:peptide/nickel transport system substrate-binding protein
VLAAAAVLIAGAATGCSGNASSAGGAAGSPVSGGTLNVVRANPFEGFDLDKGTLNSTYQVQRAVIEPLIRVGDDGTSLEPGLADSWKYSKGNRVLTIKIDKRANFSDGRPVTAADVAFSVKTWQSGPNYGATYAGITSTKAVGEKTIELHLAAPDTALPAFLSWANAGVVPDHFGGVSAKEYWQHPIGAGAFTVDSWSGNGKIVLKKNPDYYEKGRPYVDEVVSTFASDPNSITLQMQSEQIDLADEILPVTAKTLGDDVYAGPEHLTPVLLMNTKDPALADVDVRRAIGYAIDYDSIVESAFRGYGRAPEGALPTNLVNWAPPSEPYYSHDPDRAKQLLAGAGDAPQTLELAYPNDASSSVMAQVIQDDLADIGITVELRASDSATEFGALSSGQYQLGLFSNNAISPDASDPGWYIAATQTMFTGFPTDDAITDLTAYAATASAAKKKEEITRLQDLWTDNAPFIALAHTASLTGVRTDAVHGVHIAPWGAYNYDSIWKSQ